MWVIEMRITGIPKPEEARMRERVETLGRAGKKTAYSAAQGTLTVRTSQDHPDPLEALKAARGRALAAVEEAGVSGATVEALTVMTEAEEERLLMRPELLDVVGATQSARILDVSQPRASALMGLDSPRRDPEAPTPIVTTNAGSLYYRQAVERYAASRDAEGIPWKRRRTDMEP